MVFGFVAPSGRGKSNFLINLGAALALRGKRTILVDHAYPVPALDILAGVADEVIYTVADVAEGRVPLSHALLPLTVGKGKKKREDLLFLLPASPVDEKNALSSVLSQVGDTADMVLCDLSHEDALSREGMDGLFLVTETDGAALRAAEAFCAEATMDGFFLAEHPTMAEEALGMPPIAALLDEMRLPLMGILPPMPRGLAGIVTGKPRATVYLRGVENVAERLLGKQVPLLYGIPLEGMTREGYIQRDK